MKGVRILLQSVVGRRATCIYDGWRFFSALMPMNLVRWHLRIPFVFEEIFELDRLLLRLRCYRLMPISEESRNSVVFLSLLGFNLGIPKGLPGWLTLRRCASHLSLRLYFQNLFYVFKWTTPGASLALLLKTFFIILSAKNREDLGWVPLSKRVRVIFSLLSLTRITNLLF